VISSPPSWSVSRLFARKEVIANAGSINNVTPIDKLDGSLELSLGSGELTVQIVRADISKESTDLIMHVVDEDFSFTGGVAKALIRAGGDSIIQECKALGKPALFSTQYTKAGKLDVPQIAHVIASDSVKVADLKICLEKFFDDVIKKNIARISLSAMGAGTLGRSESESADLIFDTLSRIAESKNLALSLVRIVIVDKAKFINFKDATKTYFAFRGSSSSTQPAEAYSPSSGTTSLARLKESNHKHLDETLLARSAQTTARDEGRSIKIYSDDRSKIDKVWQELKRMISENILEKTMIMNDDIINKFSFRDHDMLRKLEREYDVRIEVDCSKMIVKIKGHSVDVANVQEKIAEILKDIKDNKSKFKDNILVHYRVFSTYLK
jgi:O-acetyl-ADP-ribose deacetylase (regulator of RNase III)